MGFLSLTPKKEEEEEEEAQEPFVAPANPASSAEEKPPEDTPTDLPILNAKSTAMKDEKAMDPNDVQRAKYACNENLKQQSGTSLSQIPEDQPVINTPDQEKKTRDGEQPSELLTSPSSKPDENAVYLFSMTSSPLQDPLPMSPRTFSTAESFPHQLPIAPSGSTSGWEKDEENEFLLICTSDIVLGSPVQKRPRLLPPDRKMYVEVRKKEASPPWEEHMRSPDPVRFNHLVNFQRNAPVHPAVENLSPTTGVEAASVSHVQEEHLSLERSSSQPDPMMLTREWMNSQHSHLPPKKRYTRRWLQEMCCNTGQPPRSDQHSSV